MRASRDPAAILERKPRFVHEKSRAARGAIWTPPK
jgi:hypothetical protein